ncbi:ribosome biogenesis GTPase Der [Thermosediminibacter oceani]|uniref:GTPase Der n=1 Tax=Thermosediminibacter oceani (strain ATCC BAA-1034 / DSM 16646 / JW/IW-1228P) TaxID=555079 RepID=D9S2W3_THEOJ|nr:ribosome biogenesis GTPase Der [Thermosediminibacter oceani]ADL07740.1 ribosome-associated GTPase EngA [Thermosediminibacter oceani DSM 16646]
MSFTVAIVGRPNVGKSTLFNRIIGKRISIVDDKPGVTRDRIYGQVEWRGKKFTLVDTGGIDPEGSDVMTSHIRRQVEFAIDSSDLILFLLDSKEGLLPTDKEVAALLRKSGKPIIPVINKVDDYAAKPELYEFYQLGLGEPVFISAIHGSNVGDLLDQIVGFIDEDEGPDYDEGVIKVAVVGKPNVGKSSLVNAILGEERVIVSDIPGTTRDAIDTPFEYEGQKMVLIDTAGMRRKSRVKEDIEFYSNIRALGAVERADIVLVVLDATQEISEQDKKIAGIAHEAGKAVIIVVNKWDLVEKDDKTIYRYTENIRKEFAFIQYAPIVFVSAKTKKRVNKVLELIRFVMDQYTFRIEKGVLNELVEDATAMLAPPTIKGRRLKIYSVAQIGVKPPTFVLTVNDTELLHFSYVRYLENKLRERFGLEGTPVVIKGRNKK